MSQKVKVHGLISGEKKLQVEGEVSFIERKTRTDKVYYSFSLKDETGELVSNIFDKDPMFATIPTLPTNLYAEVTMDYFVKDGYNNVTLHEITPMERPRMVWVELDEMKKEFKQYLKGIEHPELKKLVMTIFKDKALVEKFFMVPSSLDSVYSYEGGLLQSTLRKVRLAEKVIEEWQGWSYNKFDTPPISRDLVIVSLLVGDLGKTETFRLNENFYPELTEKSHLLSGSHYGLYLVQKVMRDCSFTEEEELVLLHTIGANGGDFARGGRATEPVTTEARIVDAIGMLDWSMGFAEKAKLNQTNDSSISHVKHRTHWLNTTFLPVEPTEETENTEEAEENTEENTEEPIKTAVEEVNTVENPSEILDFEQIEPTAEVTETLDLEETEDDGWLNDSSTELFTV